MKAKDDDQVETVTCSRCGGTDRPLCLLCGTEWGWETEWGWAEGGDLVPMGRPSRQVPAGLAVEYTLAVSEMNGFPQALARDMRRAWRSMT